MRNELAKLSLNLVAGLRLALMTRVSRLAFRIDIVQLLLLFLLSALLDVGIDWIRYGPDPYFSLTGAGNEIYSGGLIMLTAALLAIVFRQRELIVAVPLISLAAYPILQFALVLPSILQRWSGVRIPAWLPYEWAVIAWAVLVLARSVLIALAPRGRFAALKALAGGLALAAPIWIAPSLLPTETWWKQPAVHGEIDPRYPSPASEGVLAAQADLLDDALTALEEQRPGQTDLYFIGFGGDAQEDVFRKDVLAARKVMEERWDTHGRSISLINNPRTLLDTPVATVSNLRTVLNELGSTIDPEQDVVMLYLTSHGRANHEFEIALPPLELAQLTPTVLRKLFDDAGIKWRIIVVSACYSGGFIPALEDDQTLVLTASAADTTSFGCGHQSERTYFGEALFDDGLAKADSMLTAFELAKRRVATREAAEGFPPSKPQISLGAEMADKLRELERGRAARRTGRSV